MMRYIFIAIVFFITNVQAGLFSEYTGRYWNSYGRYSHVIDSQECGCHLCQAELRRPTQIAGTVTTLCNSIVKPKSSYDSGMGWIVDGFWLLFGYPPASQTTDKNTCALTRNRPEDNIICSANSYEVGRFCALHCQPSTLYTPSTRAMAMQQLDIGVRGSLLEYTSCVDIPRGTLLTARTIDCNGKDLFQGPVIAPGASFP